MSVNKRGVSSIGPFRDVTHAGLWLLSVDWAGPVTVKLTHGRIWEIPAGVTASDLIRTPWIWGN